MFNANKRKIAGIAGSIIVVIALAYALYTVLASLKPPVYTLTDTTLEITAEFGETINLADISNVQLQNDMPDNLVKVSGANMGSILLGNFQSNGDALKIYVDTSVPPFIYITTNQGLVIINNRAADDTQALFNQLEQKIAPAATN